MGEIINNLDWSVLTEMLLSVIPALICITLHELSHGFVAYKLGDNTAKHQGRLTLNPLKHIDWIGALCLVVFKFGWAKPVPVNSFNFKNRKRDIIIVSLAGPVSNFIIAFVAMLIVSALVITSYPMQILATFLITLVYLNIGLGVFNLIPVPPLDGSKILGEFLNSGAKYKYLSFERYGSLVLLLIFAIRPLNNIFSSVLMFLQGIVLTGYSKAIEFILGVF